MRSHVVRLRLNHAPVDPGGGLEPLEYRDLLAAAPHPSGDTQADHLHTDALWSRARSFSVMDPDANNALDGRTFDAYDPDRPFDCPALIMRPEPAYGATFLPEHEARLWPTSSRAKVVAMPGAGHNIRGVAAGTIDARRWSGQRTSTVVLVGCVVIVVCALGGTRTPDLLIRSH